MDKYAGWDTAAALEDVKAALSNLANQQQTATAAAMLSQAQQSSLRQQQLQQAMDAQSQAEREQIYKRMMGAYGNYFEENQKELDKIKEEKEKEEREKKAKLLKRFLEISL